MMKRALVLSGGVALSALMSASPALAGGFTIVSGQTATTTQELKFGDVGTVQAGGAINSAIAIDATASGSTVINAGSITATDDAIYGTSRITSVNSGSIVAGQTGFDLNNNNFINNSGSITSANNGIFVLNQNIISNSGSITADGVGIFVGNQNTITNSGQLTASQIGISAGDQNTIVNSGQLTGNHLGIVANDQNTIINSGSVNSTSTGILLQDDNVLNNSGSVTGQDEGVFVSTHNTITNGGTIKGRVSVWFNGDHNTLKLLVGSNIQGQIFVDGDSNRLIFGPGLNTALSYTGRPTISSALPFIVQNSVVYSVDVTGFSVQGSLANQMTEAVTGSVDGRLDSVRHAGAGFSTAMGNSVVHAAASSPQADASGFWLSGLGSYRQQAGNGTTTVDYGSSLGGVVVGRDGMWDAHTRAGGFVGSSVSGLQTQADGQEIYSTSFLGGIYLGHEMGANFIDASLSLGHSAFDSQRHVNNNLVAGGIETARADYGAFFFSPSVKLGTNRIVSGGTVTPSLRLRYTGLMIDGYGETGSAADLTVGGRTVNVFDARAELAYALNPHATEHGSWAPTLHFGIDGNLSSDGNVNASLAGQALNFSPASSNAVRGFAGLDLNVKSSHGASLTLATEAGYDTNNAFTGQASASFGFTF